MQELQVQSLGQEDPLEEEMATYSRILAWRIPWTEEPGGLQSMGVTVGRNLVTKQQQQYFTMHMYKKPLLSCVHLSGSVCGEGTNVRCHSEARSPHSVMVEMCCLWWGDNH